VLKVIDQGADDTTNAVSIRAFFQKHRRASPPPTHTPRRRSSRPATASRKPLTAGQILVYQVPIPEPLRFLEPRETETRKMHALEEYGLMHVKLYEDIARHGQHRHDLRLSGEGRGALCDGPLADPEIRQPEDAGMSRRSSSSAPAARSASTPCRPYTRSSASTSRTTRSRSSFDRMPCALCGANGQSISTR
jgi:alpha-D-ribose 1-methylphosphonate 5-phosphate C-P lyase